MKKSLRMLMVGMFILIITSCAQKPYDKPEFIDIPSNATAFVVPLTGKTGDQAQFMSEEYLETNKVAVKRIQIPHEWVQEGRLPENGRYIPTVTVLLLDRTPVSVTWAKLDSGNVNPLRIAVESKESIGFTIPVSITAMIDESNAAKFLAKYTTGRTLASVVNTDVNAYIKTRASAKFGKLTLEECKNQKAAILDDVFVSAKEFFKPYGITLSQFGMTDGFYYDDETYQAAINKSAVLQAEAKNLDEREKNAEKQRQIDIRNATASARVASIQAESATAMLRLQEVENSRILAAAKAQAIIEFAKRAVLPNILPEGSFYKLGLDGLIPTAQ